jgi:Mg-chelatase subunit ChlD
MNAGDDYRLRNTHAAMTPDGRYLVVNTGIGLVNVVNLATGTTELVSTPGLAKTLGVEFNYGIKTPTYVAISGHSAVGVYEFLDDGQFVPVGLAPIPGQQWPPGMSGTYELVGRHASMAWTGHGDGIVVAINGEKEFRILDFRATQDPVLQKRLDFDSCAGGRYTSTGTDVLTLNDRLRSPTPSPTATATASVTPLNTPSATAVPPTLSPTLRPSSTPTITASPSGVPTAAPSPSATAPPGVAFLPLALNEGCSPSHKRADVALVVDTSSSMAGQKLADAKEAATLFVGLMDLSPGRDQVTVVRFDTTAEVVQPLTSDAALLVQAIASLSSRQGTHIDEGLRAALAELQSARRDPANQQVTVLLTDGIQTGTPGAELQAAAAVTGAGIRLYTIGLGADADGGALSQMAGAGGRYYFAPDSAALAEIYRQVAHDIACPVPAGGFWGQQP